MTKKWLNWINLGIAILTAMCLLAAGIFALMRPNIIEPVEPSKEQRKLPKLSFELPPENYNQLNPSLLQIKTSPPSILLPNLKTVLNYYGKNGRPDANQEKPLMHFNLTGNKEPASVLPNNKLFLSLDRNVAPPKYIFSPNNTPTPLWIEPFPYESQALVRVNLLDDDVLIKKPSAYAEFMVQEKEFARYGGTTWDMGKWRVDGTLLARQKARWYGQDLFLEKHGGKEYAYAKGKQRIDFGEGDDSYSIFIDEHTCAIWKDDRWQTMVPGVETRPYPLLCVKKIDTRLINMELWDNNGRSKVVLNILKSVDTPVPKTLQQTLKFVGARTLSQFLFEVNKQRIQLRPNDWLLYKDNRWQLLNDPVNIKSFVDRKISGPLFVFEGVSRKEDRQVLKGTLYNTSRTEATEVEIPLVPAGSNSKTQKKDDKKVKGTSTTNTIKLPPKETKDAGQTNNSFPTPGAKTNLQTPSSVNGEEDEGLDEDEDLEE